MEKLPIILGSVVAGFGGMFALVVLGPFFGGMAGWVVGLVFGDTILGIFS